MSFTYGQSLNVLEIFLKFNVITLVIDNIEFPDTLHCKSCKTQDGGGGSLRGLIRITDIVCSGVSTSSKTPCPLFCQAQRLGDWAQSGSENGRNGYFLGVCFSSLDLKSYNRYEYNVIYLTNQFQNKMTSNNFIYRAKN